MRLRIGMHRIRWALRSGARSQAAVRSSSRPDVSPLVRGSLRTFWRPTRTLRRLTSRPLRTLGAPRKARRGRRPASNTPQREQLSNTYMRVAASAPFSRSQSNRWPSLRGLPAATNNLERRPRCSWAEAAILRSRSGEGPRSSSLEEVL